MSENVEWCMAIYSCKTFLNGNNSQRRYYNV